MYSTGVLHPIVVPIRETDCYAAYCRHIPNIVMSKKRDSLSKFLSLILRHQPATIGLTLDAQGWASIADLIALANAHGTPLTESLLHEIVVTNDKQRFAVSEDGSRIRANQGHSLAVDLNLQAQTPPEILFHGTSTRFIASIRQQGLVAGSRQYVHLSSNKETAVSVGTRYGVPVLLEVAALAMQQAGHTFFLSENGVWLTAAVPVSYLHFPEN